MPTNKSDDWYTLPVNFARMESRGSTVGLRPEITNKLGIIREVFQRYAGGPKYQINMRAGQEWNPKHGLFSLHHTGFAVDIRTNDLPGGGIGHVAQQIAEELKGRLGDQYFVLLHRPPDPPHIHVQFRRGRGLEEKGWDSGRGYRAG